MINQPSRFALAQQQSQAMPRTLTTPKTPSSLSMAQSAQPKFGNSILAEKFLIEAGEWGAQVSKQYLQPKKGFQAIVNPILFFAREVVERFTQKQDYTVFANVGSLQIAAPPKGALLLLLYPFTIGTRLIQAIKRAPELPNGEKDYREVGDVLRRDMFAITTFVFGLHAISNAGYKLFEKLGKVKIGEYGFNKLDETYFLNSGNRLLQLLSRREGDAAHNLNRQGLLKAIETMDLYGSNILKDHRETYRGLLKTLTGFMDESDQLVAKGLKSGELQALVAKYFADAPADLKQKLLTEAGESARAQVLSKFFGQEVPELAGKSADDLKAALTQLLESKSSVVFEHLDGNMNGVLKDLRKAGLEGLQKAKMPILDRLVGLQDYKSYFGRYAKLMKLPVDIVGFAIIVVMLGYGPVWFNDLYSRLTYNKAKEAKKAEAMVKNQTTGASPIPPALQPKLQPNPWNRIEANGALFSQLRQNSLVSQHLQNPAGS